MHLVVPVPALVQHRQLEQRPHVRAIARQRDENRHVHGVVLGVLTVRVKVNCPVVPAHGERVAHYVLPDAHPFRQRVPLYDEPMRPVNRLAGKYRARAQVVAGLGIRRGSHHRANCHICLQQFQNQFNSRKLCFVKPEARERLITRTV